jgi:hypothetical protein
MLASTACPSRWSPITSWDGKRPNGRPNRSFHDREPIGDPGGPFAVNLLIPVDAREPLCTRRAADLRRLAHPPTRLNFLVCDNLDTVSWPWLAAPCQCLSLGGNQITSPGQISSIGPPSTAPGRSRPSRSGFGAARRGCSHRSANNCSRKMGILGCPASLSIRRNRAAYEIHYVHVFTKRPVARKVRPRKPMTLLSRRDALPMPRFGGFLHVLARLELFQRAQPLTHHWCFANRRLRSSSDRRA